MATQQHCLAGRYEVRSLIGSGGMAEVHLGYDIRLSRVVAIKMLRTDLARDSIFQERFRREAQSAASLNHPNIVAVYDTGEESETLPDGSSISIPFIIMEYVEGHTVRQLLSDGQPVPIDEAVEITTGVLNALEYSHSQGLVHRDIKPGNIMLTMTGKVKVMDFGIARALEDSAATMTSTDAVIGTAQYLSPEQARGENVDTRSDLYSTGCLLYELLTGRPPFRGDSAVAVAYQHVSEQPKPPSSVTPDLSDQIDRVVLKSLMKIPSQRYQDAARFRTDLQAAVAGMAVSAPTVAALNDQFQPIPTTETMSMPQSMRVAHADPFAQAQLQARRAAQEKRRRQQEQRAKEKRRQRVLWSIFITLLLLLLIGGSTFAWYYLSKEQQPETVVIPQDIIGLTQAQASERLLELELNPVFGEAVPSDDVKAGHVAATDPAPGTKVDKGSRVTLSLSSGRDEVPVPDVTGLSQDRARTIIEAAGLRVGNISSEDSANVDADHVIRSDPEADTSVPKDTVINLTLSSGYVTVERDKVVGKKKDEALKYLSDELKLSTNTLNESTDAYQPDTVISIKPDGRVAQRSQITLTIAVAPPEPPLPQPEPDDPSPTKTKDDKEKDNN
ncbi:MAG: Stk1 family PASTA domain-containing Ser/Thr kinase [Actinomycetaceae bacterium]|nr:Stk1 family PASTA domain-containing Ser/Thr kinase [Actinomycetaceae bacterium]